MTTPIDTLVTALKEAMAHGEPRPLYRGVKQPGLFASRTGVAGEAAAQAVREGLLEVVRREAKGKTETEWVRVTPLGVQFVHQHESPRGVLEELVQTLRAGQSGLPLWADEMRAQLHALGNRFTEALERHTRQMEQLLLRAESALQRLRPTNAENTLAGWQLAGIEYLRKRQTGSASHCPLAELFNALRAGHADLSVAIFHEGLAELRDRGAIELVPFGGHLSDLAEPEYALLEGSAVYSAAKTSGRDGHCSRGL